MFNKKVVLPQEGNLLFENKTLLQKFGLWWSLITVLYFLFYISWGFKDGMASIPLLLHIYFVLDIIFLFGIVVGLVSGFKDGFKDETYEGYFFSDKIVFYRTSRYVDEVYTEKKTKEELLIEIIAVKDEISNHQKWENISLNDATADDLPVLSNNMELAALYLKLQRLEKGVEVARNLRMPHKIELEFKDVKYFINEKNEIKIVEEEQDNENELNRFFNKIELANKYKKHKSEVVEFLNKQVKYTKKKIAMEEVADFE